MIAEKDIHMKATTEEMYVLSADELIQQRCRARDDYMKNENTWNKIMKELTEELKANEKELEAKKKELEAKKKEINLLKQQLSKAHSQNS